MTARRIFTTRRVYRENSGGSLWAPVDQFGLESGSTPSYDGLLVDKECERLNALPPAPLTPRQFYDACERFDWYYDMSDDYRVVKAGSTKRAALMEHAPAGSENARLWDAFKAHHYSGEAFSTPKAPKPERPQGLE